MSNDQEFYIEQIKTTKKIIETFSDTDEFSPTMLINSLLSLVILPFEKAKEKDGKRIFTGSYTRFKKEIRISPSVFTPIKSCSEEKPCLENKSIYSYVRKFRNGIAHQNLEVFVKEDKVIYIKIYNIYPCGVKCSGKSFCPDKKELSIYKNKGFKGVIDFEITLTVPELQKLALYIANSYLKAIIGKESLN